MLVTVHPEHLSRTILSLVDAVIAVGPYPQRTLSRYSDASGQTLVWPRALSYKAGQAVVWFPRTGEPPFSMGIIPPRVVRIRHRRKYAEGNMRHLSFYFRGPHNRHNIRAHNLAIFSQIAEGIDEETWLFHLYRGDYSKWFREAIKDPYLADQTERVEQRPNLPPKDGRILIRSLIDTRYTLPE